MGHTILTNAYYVLQRGTEYRELVPHWFDQQRNTGAPGLAHLDDWQTKPADPFNPYEPVDSSAAAIGAQGLLRLGRWDGVGVAVRDGHVVRLDPQLVGHHLGQRRGGALPVR